MLSWTLAGEQEQQQEIVSWSVAGEQEQQQEEIVSWTLAPAKTSDLFSWLARLEGFPNREL